MASSRQLVSRHSPEIAVPVLRYALPNPSPDVGESVESPPFVHDQVTRPLPSRYIPPVRGSLDVEMTDADDEIETFPESQDPVKDLVSARNELLKNLRDHAKLTSLYSRLTPFTGHLKEGQDLSRTRVCLPRMLQQFEEHRARRLEGNKARYFKRGGQYSEMRRFNIDEPQGMLILKLMKECREAALRAKGFEVDYGWEVVRTFGNRGKRQGALTSFNAEASNVTKLQVVESLLILRNTYPAIYKTGPGGDVLKGRSGRKAIKAYKMLKEAEAIPKETKPGLERQKRRFANLTARFATWPRLLDRFGWRRASPFAMDKKRYRKLQAKRTSSFFEGGRVTSCWKKRLTTPAVRSGVHG